jgi:hypothetical protein
MAATPMVGENSIGFFNAAMEPQPKLARLITGGVTELWSMISERRAWDPRPPAVMVARIVFAFCCAAPLIWLVSNMLATGARALAQ